MAKPTPTRTTNPIHFEDLDPKRFEDLIRELVYDFKDWQSIEATGKGGADDGFDIRAYERAYRSEQPDTDEEPVVHPMDGNLWMIQCKREKAIASAKIKSILADIDSKNPPYGYILAAPVNFSKAAYDTFRADLMRRGVMEFYLWGKSELELQLHQPKNDRILFTFFGISNTVRRRSRATEIRSEVTNKNRVLRTFTDHPADKTVLIRNAADLHYPNSEKYHDFDTQPRWQLFEIVDHHPRGLILNLSEHYAYIDDIQKQYDVASSVSLRFHNHDDHDAARRHQDTVEPIRDFHELMPRRNQATFHTHGLVTFNSMLVVDDKGDNLFRHPHIFVDFIAGHKLTDRTGSFLKFQGGDVLLDGYTRIKHFPTKFPARSFGTVHTAPLAIPEKLALDCTSYRTTLTTLFDVDGSYCHLAVRDVVIVKSQKGETARFQITHTWQTKVGALLKDHPEMSLQIQHQIGRGPAPEELITLFELRPVYEWMLKQPETKTD